MSAMRDHWAESFARLEERRNGAEPLWLRGTRKAAMARFVELGFPTRKDEEWKYTNVAPIAKLHFGLPQTPTRKVSPADLHKLGVPDDQGARLVLVNGRFSPELSQLGAAEAGVEIGSLAERVETHPASVEPYLTRYAPFDGQSFAALNTAFFADGAFVRIAPGATPSTPILLVFVTLPGAEPESTHPRVLVVADAGSGSTLVELYASLGDRPYLTNAVTEVAIGEGAQVEHVRLQGESDRAFHVSTLATEQGRDSRFVAHSLSFGAALARHDVVDAIGAEGAECTLRGLYVATGSQHVDNHTTIDHRRPHGTSRELYKGILAGASRGVFNGKIIVRPDAQKTDARQKNDNLLISEQAEVATQPQLEIHADDVRCSHGSTIGHLEEDPLFYLRSRGLPERDARALLTQGFAGEITRAVPVETLRDRVNQLIGRRLFGSSATPEAG
jgi:Fe-S cluster assembly protein SufD